MGVETDEPKEVGAKKSASIATRTLEALDEMRQGMTEIKGTIIRAFHRLDEKDKEGDDHEQRLRVLEASVTSLVASRGTATWIFQVIWPISGVIIGLIPYLTK